MKGIKNHQDTPVILQNIDRVLGEYVSVIDRNEYDTTDFLPSKIPLSEVLRERCFDAYYSLRHRMSES